MSMSLDEHHKTYRYNQTTDFHAVVSSSHLQIHVKLLWYGTGGLEVPIFFQSEALHLCTWRLFGRQSRHPSAELHSV